MSRSGVECQYSRLHDEPVLPCSEQGQEFRDTTDSYNRQDYRDLTDSVREQGMHTPLHVGEGEHGPAVWDGHHRYITARRAGLTHLPVAYGPAAIDNAVAAYHENRGS